MYIYQQAEIKKIDEFAMMNGLSYFSLMENAGKGLYQTLLSYIHKDEKILVLAGRGNNGGDGVVLARYLQINGYHVVLVFPVGSPKTETAKQHLLLYEQQGFSLSCWNPEEHYDVIVDCLLGVGMKLPLKEEIRNVIVWANEKKARRIAIDLPTGVQADNGKVETAFKADATFFLHGAKPAAFLLPSSTYFGQTSVVDIGIPQKSSAHVWTLEAVQSSWPRRSAASHKGTFGTGLIIAGSDEMPGSAMLSGIGALRSGIGKLMIATSAYCAAIIAGRIPEATYLFDGLEKVAKGKVLKELAAVGIGPGLQDKTNIKQALSVLLEQDIPLVIDAGALLEKAWKTSSLLKRKAPIVLTPHPGEFSRLTGASIQEIAENRLELARLFAKSEQVIVVLKGQHTVIAFPDGEIIVNPTGNPALAKGGSGDVLLGMIVAMLATHRCPRSAIANAVYIHGLCGDEYTAHASDASMVASDMERLLPAVLNRIEVEKMIH